MLNPFRSVVLAGFLASAFATPRCAVCQSDGKATYTIQHQWVIGGEGGWDYMLVDAAAHRLYIAQTTSVDAVDLETGKLVGGIGGLVRTHGIVIPPGGKNGFISDGGANKVIVFDPATLAKTGSIPAETNPDGMAFEASTKTLWAFNGGSDSATVIDVASQKPIATIALPGKPEFPASDGEGTVYVNIEDKNLIVRLDAKEKKITAAWPLPGCESPSGLAYDKAGARLFSVCDGKTMAVTDAHTGEQLGRAAIGDGPDAVAYDAAHKLVFASNGDGTLSVVDAAGKGYPTVQTISTMKGARTLALDPSTGVVYTVSAKLGPPMAAAPGKKARPSVVPGTMTVIAVGR